MNTLIINKEGIATFLRDGVQQICPFRSPNVMPVQSKLGGQNLQIVSQVCSTQCPFCKIVDRNDNFEIVAKVALSCRPIGTFHIGIDEVKDESNNIPGPKLVS